MFLKQELYNKILKTNEQGKKKIIKKIEKKGKLNTYELA